MNLFVERLGVNDETKAAFHLFCFRRVIDVNMGQRMDSLILYANEESHSSTKESETWQR